MARTNQAPANVAGEMTAEETAQLDQMRADDVAPIDNTTQDAPPADDVGEQAPADDGGQPPADERQKYVPHAALHEERERRKAVEAQAAQERQRFEERFNMLLQRVAPPQPAAPQQQQQAPEPIPDIATDPVGHIVGTISQQNRMIAQQEQVLRDVVQVLSIAGQQNQQSQVVNQVRQHAMALEREFSAQTPDYAQAVAFLGEHRHKELESLGWTDPAERQNMIMQEADGIAHRALSTGRNPAEVVYGLAKYRGFQAPAAQVQTPTQDTGQRLETINRGQQQNARSLGNARGAAPLPMTGQRLLEMSDDDFENAMKTPEGRAQLGA